MVMFTARATMIAVLAAASANAQALVIARSGSRAVRPAPSQNFTGGVQVEVLFEAVDPSDASGGLVTFEPGARTTWHSHPRGQILIITAGTGRIQRWGDPVVGRTRIDTPTEEGTPAYCSSLTCSIHCTTDPSRTFVK